MFCIPASNVIYVNVIEAIMKVVSKNELIRIGKMRDPETELYEMSSYEISFIKRKIVELVLSENDDVLFSTLMRLKSHIMIVEDFVREKELMMEEKLCIVPTISCYRQQQMGMELLYA